MTSQDTTPTNIVLPAGLQATLDAIIARNRARFGHDAFRMEETGGDGDGGGDNPQGGDGDSGEDNPPVDPPAGQRVEDLPEWAQKIIRDTRNEAATRRANADKQAKTAAEQATSELVQKLGKALGLVKDGEGEQVDVDALTKQATDAQAAARTAAVELAVYKTASKHQGDPDALLDSRAFLAKVADLDPSSTDFGSKVDIAIKEAVADHPKLKAAPGGGSSSVDHGTGGTGGGGNSNTPKSLEDSIKGHYGT